MKGRMDTETPVQKFHLQSQHRSVIVHFVQPNISNSWAPVEKLGVLQKTKYISWGMLVLGKNLKKDAWDVGNFIIYPKQSCPKHCISLKCQAMKEDEHKHTLVNQYCLSKKHQIFQRKCLGTLWYFRIYLSQTL